MRFWAPAGRSTSKTNILFLTLNGLLLTVLATAPAKADVISTYAGTILNSTPIIVSLAPGSASLAFTPATTGYGPGAAVATSGTAAVTSFAGGVTDFEGGSTIDQTGELYSFAQYPTPATIPYSAADDFIGFDFLEGDGTHYGYAEVSGLELVGYAFQSTAGQSIVTNTIVPAMAPTPEPGTLLLLGTGLTCVFGSLKRRTHTIRS
jgi:hypothetical protein